MRVSPEPFLRWTMAHPKLLARATETCGMQAMGIARLTQASIKIGAPTIKPATSMLRRYVQNVETVHRPEPFQMHPLFAMMTVSTFWKAANPSTWRRKLALELPNASKTLDVATSTHMSI